VIDHTSLCIVLGSGETFYGIGSIYVTGWAAIVSGLLTLALVVGTFSYARTARASTRLAEEAILQQQRPVLVLRELSDSLSNRKLQLVNVGSGPALGVTVKANATFQDNAAFGEWLVFEATSFSQWPCGHEYLESVPEILGVGSENAHVLYEMNSSMPFLTRANSQFQIEYRDVFGRDFVTVMNMGRILTIGQIIPPTKLELKESERLQRENAQSGGVE
jgi:hypothetical protein